MIYKDFLTQDIPEAVKKLNQDKIPLWGKMTPQHMIEHLTQSVLASTIFTLTAPRPLSNFQLEAKKRLIQSTEPFPRGLQNPIFQYGLPPYEHSTIEIAKEKLIEKIHLFFKVFEAKPEATSFNLFLGDLTFEELQIFHTKHFTHHFSQFELL
jgi:oxepin-CoA hydrolase/3-oxo-5,6-dehydrosuberyl-CoA semialdehyde dehydrogenase